MRNIRWFTGWFAPAVALVMITAPWVAAQTTPSAGLQQISGKIFSVDDKKGVLKLEAQKAAGASPQLMDFTISDKTVITAQGQKVAPKDLQFGKQVQVEYAVENGKNVARSIRLEQAASSHPPTGGAAPQGAEHPQGSDRPQGQAQPQGSERPQSPQAPSNPSQY